MDKPSQTELMDAACCLWEEVLSWTKGRNHNCTIYREDYGWANLRGDIIKLAGPCHEAWCNAHRNGHGYDNGFDWEFCPWFLANCVHWDHRYGPNLKPDWRDLATKLGENWNGNV